MKKKLILLTALLLMCCPFIYGCNSESSDIPTAKTNTSWDDNINDIYNLALDKDAYPYSKEIYINVDENSKLIDYTIIVEDDTTAEEAVQYATDLIKSFNDNASEKDNSISKSSEDSYGGVFDTYDVVMTIATEESVLTEKDWLVCQTIKAGEHTPIKSGGFSAT